MKKIVNIIASALILLIVLVGIVRFTGNGYLLKGLWASYMHGYSSASIDDARFFNTNAIETTNNTYNWPMHEVYNTMQLSDSLLRTLEQVKTTAFLVLKNDSILFEKYWDSYSDSSRTNSFSMAKSITTMLAQIAIQKGLLNNWQQKVNTIFPELKGPYADSLELWHLSAMCSGLQWDEKYKDPFSITAKAYYGEDVTQLMMQLPIVSEPGKEHNYQSGSTQLLGLCLMKVTGQSLSQLASDWLWIPLQATHRAQWHTDNKGTELAYCCFNSNARDFARFGSMMLHQGNWRGTQILDTAFVELATKPVLVPYYGYSFWLDDSHGTPVFYQRGILGQYIISLPEYNAVIVRLGHERIPPRDDQNHTDDFHTIVSEVLKMLQAQSS